VGIFEIGGISIFLAFAAGTLSVASPCVLPLIPAYLGYLTGAAIDSPEPAAATTAASTASGGGAGVATVGGGPASSWAVTSSSSATSRTQSSRWQAER
jgi:cytochrome c biogenesis protein CcdA